MRAPMQVAQGSVPRYRTGNVKVHVLQDASKMRVSKNVCRHAQSITPPDERFAAYRPRPLKCGSCAMRVGAAVNTLAPDYFYDDAIFVSMQPQMRVTKHVSVEMRNRSCRLIGDVPKTCRAPRDVEHARCKMAQRSTLERQIGKVTLQYFARCTLACA